VAPRPASSLILSSMKSADETASQADHGTSGRAHPVDNKP
jgi:membrane fusion protein, multidrug efflux system